jgi:hypothetical protein
MQLKRKGIGDHWGQFVSECSFRNTGRRAFRHCRHRLISEQTVSTYEIVTSVMGAAFGNASDSGGILREAETVAEKDAASGLPLGWHG